MNFQSTLIAAALLAATACTSDPVAEAKAAAKHAQEAAELAKKAADKVNANTAKKTPPKDIGEATKQMGDAFNQLGKQMAAATGDGKVVEPIDHKVLKKEMPDKAAGLKRTKLKAQKTGFGGAKVSNVEARYKEGTKQVDIKVSDAGGFTPMTKMATMWATVEIDEEGDDGYKRTTKVAGYPAMEQYRTSGKRGTMSLLIDGRIIIEIKTRNIDPKELKGIAEELDLKAIQKLAVATVK